MIKPGIALVNIFYPIGSYYETSNNNFDPNVEWGGTWELDLDGTVLASRSSSSSSKFNTSVGTIVGEEKHKLTISEIPNHSHAIGKTNKTGDQKDGYSVTGDYTNNGTYNVGATGGNQPHNIIQPSKVVNRWHRIA